MPRLRFKTKLDSRSARLDLSIRRRPYGFALIAPRIGLGYRRNRKAGAWVVRGANGKGGYWFKKLSGIADDFETADGVHVLDFWQACDQAKALARGTSADSRPVTWAVALDRYQADLRARGGDEVNATRLRGHLPPSLLDKPVSLLTAAELRRWRDSLLASGKLKPLTVVRTIRSAKACLNLAANLDPRIVDRSPWQAGLSGLHATYTPVNKILSDSDVLRLVAEAYTLGHCFGLFIDVLASTGTRTSQACRLLIADLQANRPDPRVMMPSSRKGGRGRKDSHKPVPIPEGLACKLRHAAAGRPPDAPLLTRADGAAWQWKSTEIGKLFGEVARRAGITCTAYALRHSSIVRALLAGTPVRVVAALHDTGIVSLERTYSAFISDHSDTVARRGLLDTSQPSGESVVPLSGRR
jgi:integrase